MDDILRRKGEERVLLFLEGRDGGVRDLKDGDEDAMGRNLRSVGRVLGET